MASESAALTFVNSYGRDPINTVVRHLDVQSNVHA